jgi:hypothetical protein
MTHLSLVAEDSEGQDVFALALPGPGHGTEEEEEWVREGALLRVQGQANERKDDAWKYSVGDWWNKGAWGSSTRKRGLKEIGRSVGTVTALAHAARSILIPCRQGISISAAQEIAAVPAEHRERYMAEARNGAGPKQLRTARYEEFGKKERKSTTRAKPATSGKTKRQAELAELHGIREQGEDTRYAAMIAAIPAETPVNRPMLDRAEKVEVLISDLTALSPVDAAAMMPPNRVRTFTLDRAQWWLEFARACEARRLAETPDLKPLLRRSAIAARASGGATTEEKLTPVERAVLDALRGHTASDGQATLAQLGMKVKVTGKIMSAALKVLTDSKLAEVAGKEGRFLIYRAASA